MAQVLLAEFLGTMILLLLGCGTVANLVLTGSKALGVGTSWLAIAFGWGLAVFAGVYVAFRSGAHLNPAVTLGMLARGEKEFAPGVAVTPGNLAGYLLAQFSGAFVGATLAWLAFKKHFDAEPDQGKKLAVFCTSPAIRAPVWNLVTEVIATFVLVFVIFHFGKSPAQLGPLPVALLVVGVGVALGGPTGYSLNPARDLAPRIAHALLPIPDKGPSDWGYAPVAVFGPVIGAVLAGFAARFLPYLHT